MDAKSQAPDYRRVGGTLRPVTTTFGLSSVQPHDSDGQERAFFITSTTIMSLTFLDFYDHLRATVNLCRQNSTSPDTGIT